MAKGKKSWTVLTSGDRPLDAVAKDLKKKGFSGIDVLHAIGMITGNADDEAAENARSVKGVSDVSSTPSADVGGPGDEETW